MTECIEWAKHRDDYGYGVKRVGSRTDGTRRLVGAHRWAWEQAHGAIPEGMCVLHHCDNRPCFTVEHLFLGTKKDNSDDMIAKGRARHIGFPGDANPSRRYPERMARGAARAFSKLTEDQVREIRSRYVRGVFGEDRLARQFGVSASTIRRIVTRKKWAHV